MKYTIKAVSQQVRSYDGKYGPMKSYKVAFIDVPQAVEISRKANSPAPKAGDELEGTLDMSGQYGPKFKADYSASKPGGGYSRDDAAIKAQWAIGQAVNIAVSLNTDGQIKWDSVEAVAKKLFALVNVIKVGEQPVTKEKVDEVFPVSYEQLSLDDPFAELELE